MRDVLIDVAVIGPQGKRRWVQEFAFILLLLITFLVPAGLLHAQTVYKADASANAIEGTATVESCAQCLDGNRVGQIGNGNANYLRIKGITVPTTGTYTVALYYTEGTDGGARSFTLQINGGAGPTLSNLTGNSWTAPAAPIIFQAAFTAGSTNSVGFFNATAPAPNVDHIVVSVTPIEVSNAPTTLSPTVYEGDASINTFGGLAVTEACSACLDGKRVGMLGNGSGNFVKINGITVPSTGIYSVSLYYVEGSDGGTRSFDVKFSDGSDLSLNNLTGSSWDAPSTPVTFLASFTAGSNNALTFLNANGSAPDVDHIVVSGNSNITSPATAGSSGSGGSLLPIPALPQNVVNDYVPQGFCTDVFVLGCKYYFYDRKTTQNSAYYGGWSTPVSSYDPNLPIYNSKPSSCYMYPFLPYCYFQPDFVQYANVPPVAQINLPGLGVSDVSKGVTFLLKVYTQPHEDSQKKPLINDAFTALGADGKPLFSIRTIGDQWALHSYQQVAGASSTGFDLFSPEPLNYPGNVNLYEDIFYTFTPDGRLSINKFTPYWISFLGGGINYNWEESVFDDAWPYTWVNGSREFTGISSLVLGGVNGLPSSVDGFRELKVFNTALDHEQMITLENSFHKAAELSTDMVPCNTGRWMNSGTISTPCDLDSAKGGNQNPVQLPKYPVPHGFDSGTDSFAPVSFTADDTNFNFTFSYSPPSQAPPLIEIQDPAQPPAWSPFFPVTPLDYTLYILAQDANGIHECQAALSQVGMSSNPGGGVLEAALGADYPLASLNGPDTIATAAWINPNPQNFTGTITVPAGWQCTGGQLNNSGGLQSGNNSGNPSTPPPSTPPPSNPPTNPPTNPAPSGTNIDLSVWELQEPVGTPGNPTTIPNTQLVAGYRDQYLFNSSDGTLGMKDPANPATSNCVTTPNSTHCRTEFREENRDSSAASWTPTGTNKLDATLAVIAAGGNVAIGQIHFDDSVSTKPLAELYYDDSGNISIGVEQSITGPQGAPIPLAQVTPGQPFSYELNYSNNQLSVSINGAPVSLNVSGLTGNKVYFKAGDYGQTTSPSEVHFSALTITHQNNPSIPPTNNPPTNNPPASSGATSIDPNGWYNVLNVNSGLCVEDLDFGTVKGSTVDQWTCGDGQANQQWQFTPTDSGYYQVSNRYVAMSLNVTGGVSAVSTQIPIQLWTYSGATNEQWKVVSLGNGQWKLIARNSGLCMEVPGYSKSNGLEMDQNTCDGSTAEAFTFNPVTPANVTPVAPTDPPSASAPPVAPTPDSGAWYNVVNVNSGKCADVYQGGITLGTNLDQWTCGAGQANQQWQLIPTDSGYYRINSRYVLMSFNVTGGTGAVGNNVPIQLWSYGGSSNEQFKPVYLRTDSNGNDIYAFIARNSGLCLDVPGASTANGTQLDQFTCNNSNAQAFTFVDVDPAPGSPIVPQQPAPTNPPPTNPAPPPTVAPQPNSNLWYLVQKTDGSGLCVAFPHGSTDDGTALEQLPCNSGDGSQQWQFRALANNLFVVTNNWVNLEWNVTGGVGATAAGVKIQGWGPFNGQTNEEWFAVYDGTDSNGNQHWEFSARNSLLCLDTPGGSKQSGLQFQQASCTGSSGQIFILKPVNPAQPSQAAPTNGGNAGGGPPPPQQPSSYPGFVDSNGNQLYLYVTNANSGLCLDVAGGTAYNGAQLDQYPCTAGKLNQLWLFIPTDSGFVRVISGSGHNFVWDVGGGPTAVGNNAAIDVYTWNAQTNQQWKPIQNSDGTWKFVARNSGKCLDVPQSTTAVMQLDQYGCNSTNAQRFGVSTYANATQAPGPTPNDPTKP
jgi:Alginate lyase/Ricin-type beta-trefoil lectin domain-like/Ricin-type beta-trefoil lectin domain